MKPVEKSRATSSSSSSRLATKPAEKVSWLVRSEEHTSELQSLPTRRSSDLQTTIIAVRHEARGKIPRHIQFFVQPVGHKAGREGFLVGSEIANRGARLGLRVLRRPGDEVDGSSHGIRSIEHGTRARQNFNARDRGGGQGQVEIMVAGLDVIHA